MILIETELAKTAIRFHLYFWKEEMKLLFCNLFTFTFACASLLAINYSAHAQTIDFEELTLGADTFFDGYGVGATSGSWSSQGAEFNTNQYGPGWSYSNVNDPTNAGYTNQWAAVTGTGFGGSGNYAIGTFDTFSGRKPIINLPVDRIVDSLFITNTTYAALSMKNGDGFAKKFGGSSGDDQDFFQVTFTGFTGESASGSQTGAVDFYLADYRSSQNYIVGQWTLLDLKPLGDARSVGISFESSDIGQFGINTPTYVAIDNLVLAVAAPEPSSLLVVGLASLGGVLFRRRRKN